MKHYQLWAVSAIACLALASCGNDDTVQGDGSQGEKELKGLTEFAVKVTEQPTATRTTGLYTGSRIDFYWTKDDRLWVNNTATSTLIQSTRDNINSQLIAGGVTKVPTAKFYFPGTYTEATYPVRYTGYGNNAGDKVTIKAAQAQTTPNDGSHIGADGDCGTAIANRGGDGKYTFTLLHKAAYLTFTPYYSHGFADDVKVTQIKVTANEALAGEFDFDDSGIKLSTRPTVSADNRSITLTLNGGNGFGIPSAPDHAKNAAIMVLAPGEYTGFTVEYTLYDQATHVGGTVTKVYGKLTLNEGKNRPVAANLAVTHYNANAYSMWDATQYYWKGYEDDQPILNDKTNDNYPKSTTDPRWYNPAPAVTPPASAKYDCKDCPNMNELRWYAQHGAPHWDSNTLWAAMKHLHTGGMWLKKQGVIAVANSTSTDIMKKEAPNGLDYTAVNNGGAAQYINKSIESGKPSDISDYFYLPALGDYYNNGKLQNVGISGSYWSCTSNPNDSKGGAFALIISEKEVEASFFFRTHGFCIWKADKAPESE